MINPEFLSQQDTARLAEIHKRLHPVIGQRHGWLPQPMQDVFTLAKKLAAEMDCAEEIANISGLTDHEAEVVAKSWNSVRELRNKFSQHMRGLVEAPQEDGSRMTLEEYEQNCVVNSPQRQAEITKAWQAISNQPDHVAEAFLAWENALTRAGVQLYQRMTADQQPPTPLEMKGLVQPLLSLRPQGMNFIVLNRELSTKGLSHALEDQKWK